MTRGPTPAFGAAAGALALLVRLYQWTLRPLLGPNCRFEPSCSDYAVQALRTHGAGRGTALAAWRILRCNPFATGGYDPVPDCPVPDCPVRGRPVPSARIAAAPGACRHVPAAGSARPDLARDQIRPGSADPGRPDLMRHAPRSPA